MLPNRNIFICVAMLLWAFVSSSAQVSQSFKNVTVQDTLKGGSDSSIYLKTSFLPTGDSSFFIGDSGKSLVHVYSQYVETPHICAGKLCIVSRKADMPAPINGNIFLDSNTAYYVTTEIDLLGDRIIGSRDNAIVGASPEIARIKSTGLHADSAILKSNYTLALNNISIEHSTCLNLNASGTASQVIDWYGVNFVNATTAVGVIANYDNVIVNTAGFLNSGGLTFGGSIGTIGFTNSIFNNTGVLTGINLPSTLTVTRRFRISLSSFVVGVGEIGILVDSSASIPVEGYILLNCNFSGGGTYLSGVNYNDNKARFEDNRGISNSGRFAGYYMTNNATPTVIDSVSVYRKVLGTTTAFPENQLFTHTNNRLTYIGALTSGFKLTAVITFTTGNNQVVEAVVFKNGIEQANFEVFATSNAGGRAENIPVQWFGTMQTNDYIEMYIANETGATNITVSFANLIIQEVK